MKSYYIDCRELTEKQVGEVCKELERLGYLKTFDFGTPILIVAHSDGSYWINCYYRFPNKHETPITIEELKAL